MDHVRRTDSDANIIHINYSLAQYEQLLEYHKLNEYVEQAYRAGKTNYIFIDEVQMCEGFERAINNTTVWMAYSWEKCNPLMCIGQTEIPEGVCIF